MEPSIAGIEKLLETINDPEIPVLTIKDIGMLRSVTYENDNYVITTTPTYSGCPVTGVIEADIKQLMIDNGITNFKVITKISPPWTTDWITAEARQKLLDYGISPPVGSTEDKSFLLGEKVDIICPVCKSLNTELISQFGSTACKALYKCKDCLEPFDYFKCF